ncbi:arylamine N-acetyltransferase [Pantoea sp.]
MEGIRYIADVGFGGVSMTAPLRLKEGIQQHVMSRLRVKEGMRISA